MVRATISLPTPLSPLIRTFASLRATRSISPCSAAIGWLRPIRRTCCLLRDAMPAPMGVTVLNSLVTSTIGASLIRETLDDALVLPTERHERGADRVLVGAGVVARSIETFDANVG